MQPQPDPIRVLHVDDDPAFTDLTAEFLELESERFTTVSATSASEALAMLAETDVDCVVSDYDMPGMDGITFLEAVRESHPDLPFVLFTGKGSEEVASEAISAGVTDYLQKEVGIDQYALLANRLSNVVESHRSRRDLDESRQRLSLFFDHSPLGVIEWSTGFEVVNANPAASGILGYTTTELRGRSWRTIVPPAERGAIEEVLERLLEDRGGYHSINENVTRAGERITCEWHNRVVTDGDDDVVAVLSFVRDVTGRGERERDLRRARSRMEFALSVTNAAVWEWNVETDAVTTHPDVHPVLGTEVETGTDFLEGVHPDDREAVRRALERAVETDTPYQAEFRVVRDDGVRWAEDYGEVKRGEADEPMRVVGVATDVTARKRREAELGRQNERLESFASIVAHDLRNPLNVAMGRLELVEEVDGESHTDEIARAHERMERLIDDLLTLAREGDDVRELEPVNLETTVERCVGTVDADRATVTVHSDGVLAADESRLRQLLENLLRNAVEHAGPDVTVTVGTVDDGFYVEDDGPGIPEADRERVFDAGFSTASTGTGLGLSIVDRIAAVHGWDVTVAASGSGGARFEVTGVEFSDDPRDGGADRVAPKRSR